MKINTPEGFKAIVLEGALRDLGMVSFADVLSETDAGAIYAYVADAAYQRWEDEQASPFWRELEIWFMDSVGAVAAWFLL